ncbi:hypothetical protein VOLCADRAFT_92979 [Volvox carteri f. nagariensis]|uniref:ABM domain-containing protein n=1 Tax=Volvox carteri f. nagariensis TaxID=3068 RepID=D8U106_VOLCA|nr:uncharacterized protein VOLCADRAFT_92979 [Volvox carteri f. nagariensis]EFJ46474.1 hypothetical protein VOLCADRAFT_92979 [Volvox carteri f. nagariensis]|eukprot:XP_002952331.1 hypothetical protein VOLCADRAFT_92979 [Volvox carteri f. nagariensis]
MDKHATINAQGGLDATAFGHGTSRHSAGMGNPCHGPRRARRSPEHRGAAGVHNPTAKSPFPDPRSVRCTIRGWNQLLDTLWSLQYRTPGACCASAGPVVQSASRDGSAAARAAVYYRFSSQAQAERFVAGPVFADAKARLLGSGSVSLSLWKVLVPNDMEALFKRGPAFETGVDVVLVLQPASQEQPVATDVLVELVGRLQRAALVANSVQVSCGADVMSLDTQYMWMARFPQEDNAQRFLRSPVVAELATGLSVGSACAAPSKELQSGGLTLSSMALIEVGAVEQSKQRL